MEQKSWSKILNYQWRCKYMVRYIDSSALVAEIERRIDEINQFGKKASYEIGLVDAYKIVLSFLDTHEVKEVDLEKEIREEYLKWRWYSGKNNMLVILSEPQFNKIAKHFFELGLSVNNPITAADRGMAEEIIVNLKRVEQDYRIDLTKEMEWLRNKVKKRKENNYDKENSSPSY